ACAIPPLMGAALFSEPLLRLWTGPAFAAYWPWHALMFLIPIAAALSGFGSSALMVRPRALARVNTIGAAQLLGQLALALALLGTLQERAFLLAQALGALAGLVFLLQLLVREHRLESDLLWRLAGIVALGIGLVLAAALLGESTTIVGWTRL